MTKFVNARWILGGTLAVYGFYFILYGRQIESTKYKVSINLYASFLICLIVLILKKTQLGNWFHDQLPLTSLLKVRVFHHKILNLTFRKYIYLGFGKLYGVNFDDIKAADLNQFRTFNQFFTRELKEDARIVVDPNNENTMCSPCDGRVLSFGIVNTRDSTIDCVKGNNYRLDEFVFGYKIDKGAEVD